MTGQENSLTAWGFRGRAVSAAGSCALPPAGVPSPHGRPDSTKWAILTWVPRPLRSSPGKRGGLFSAEPGRLLSDLRWRDTHPSVSVGERKPVWRSASPLGESGIRKREGAPTFRWAPLIKSRASGLVLNRWGRSRWRRLEIGGLALVGFARRQRRCNTEGSQREDETQSRKERTHLQYSLNHEAAELPRAHREVYTKHPPLH